MTLVWHFFVGQFFLWEKIALAWLLTYVVKLTALTMFFVSVASEFNINEASRTFEALRSLTIGLHLFTYTSRISSWLQKQKSLTVGQQCSVSLQPLAHMQQQVKSFLESSKWSSTHLSLINNFFKNYWKDLTKVLNGLVKNFCFAIFERKYYWTTFISFAINNGTQR